MRRSARSLITLGSLAVAVIAGTPLARAQAPAPAAGMADSSAEVFLLHEEFHHHGRARLFQDALNQVSLRPDQQTQIDALKKDYATRHAPVHAAKAALVSALADQIEAGDIDRDALEPKIDALASAIQSVNAADRQAFESLHSILDADQRGQFVDALKQRWASYKKGSGQWLSKAAAALDLTADQKTKIEGVIATERQKYEAEPAHAAAHEAWKNLLEAFRGEQFDLDKLLPNKDQTARVKAHAGAALDAAEAILPVLTPAQRTIVANKLRHVKSGGSSSGMTE